MCDSERVISERVISERVISERVISEWEVSESEAGESEESESEVLEIQKCSHDAGLYDLDETEQEEEKIDAASIRASEIIDKIIREESKDHSELTLCCLIRYAFEALDMSLNAFSPEVIYTKSCYNCATSTSGICWSHKI